MGPCDCESKIWIIKVFLKKLTKLKFGLLRFLVFLLKNLKNLSFYNLLLQPYFLCIV